MVDVTEIFPYCFSGLQTNILTLGCFHPTLS